MKRTRMLRMNYEFERVFKKGRFFNTKHLTLYVRPRQDQQLMLGVTVAKKVKGSVNRNQIKRWLREIYRHSEQEVVPGYDLILFGRVSPTETNYAALLDCWHKVAKDAKIFYTDRAD